jgi:hypothetical protein
VAFTMTNTRSPFFSFISWADRVVITEASVPALVFTTISDTTGPRTMGWKSYRMPASSQTRFASGHLTKCRLEYSRLAAKTERMIELKHLAGDEWLVSVQGAVATHHRVRVTSADIARFAENRPPDELLRESFRFLLERESNTSILTSFDLPQIGRYFPEYEREIRARLGQKTS